MRGLKAEIKEFGRLEQKADSLKTAESGGGARIEELRRKINSREYQDAAICRIAQIVSGGIAGILEGRK